MARLLVFIHARVLFAPSFGRGSKALKYPQQELAQSKPTQRIPCCGDYQALADSLPEGPTARERDERRSLANTRLCVANCLRRDLAPAGVGGPGGLAGTPNLSTGCLTASKGRLRTLWTDSWPYYHGAD